MLTKAELRKHLQEARLALASEERATKSTAIAGRLWQAIDWSAVRTVHCYEPIEWLGEVDINDFIAALEDEYPSLQFFTSRQLNNTWQIISLTNGKPISAPYFDVIVVPMLGFDAAFHRLGYGGGYYDRFLATQPQAQKIGVCFEQGKLDQLPIEPHDIPLDHIITDARSYS